MVEVPVQPVPTTQKKDLRPVVRRPPPCRAPTLSLPVELYGQSANRESANQESPSHDFCEIPYGAWEFQPLKPKNLLESNPLKSRFLVRGLSVVPALNQLRLRRILLSVGRRPRQRRAARLGALRLFRLPAPEQLQGRRWRLDRISGPQPYAVREPKKLCSESRSSRTQTCAGLGADSGKAPQAT